METALLSTPATPRRLLLPGRLRPAAAPAQPQPHLHFDRAARVWRSHEELDRRPAEVALQECA